MRSVTSNPGVSASTMKQLMPLAPGAGEHGVETRDATVGDPGLLAVEHIGIAVLGCAAGHGGDVGTGLRLGQGEGRQRFARGDRLQEALLLRWRTEQRNGPGSQTLHGEGEVGQGVVPAQDLADQAQAAHVEPFQGTPAACRDRVAGEARCAQGSHQADTGAVQVRVLVRHQSRNLLCGPASISAASCRWLSSRKGQCR
jgi:hypothetical protein